MHHLPDVKHDLSNSGLGRETRPALQIKRRSNLRQDAARTPQGPQTVNPPTQDTSTPQKPYVRRSHFEVEPAAFALALVAVVASISLWNPAPSPQQFSPAEATRTVAQAPSR